MADGSRRASVAHEIPTSEAAPPGGPTLGSMSVDVPAPAPSNHAALLVIRAWREDPSEVTLRARITEVADLDYPQEIVYQAGTRAELHRILDRWLDRLLATSS
jgi:hypothetical protein